MSFNSLDLDGLDGIFRERTLQTPPAPETSKPKPSNVHDAALHLSIQRQQKEHISAPQPNVELPEEMALVPYKPGPGWGRWSLGIGACLCLLGLGLWGLSSEIEDPQAPIRKSISLFNTLSQEQSKPIQPLSTQKMALNLRTSESEQADMRTAELEQTNMRTAELEQADIRTAELEQTDMKTAELKQADMRILEPELVDFRLGRSKTVDAEAIKSGSINRDILEPEYAKIETEIREQVEPESAPAVPKGGINLSPEKAGSINKEDSKPTKTLEITKKKGSFIFFNKNASKLTEKQLQKLQAMLPQIKNCTSKLNLRGHTCNLGGKAPNQRIARRRAASLAEALVLLGIRSHKIQIEVVGSREPLVSNKSPEGRAKNRRVEILCLD